MNKSQWTERYRPTSLSTVKGQETVKDLLKRLTQSGILECPHLILYGPPGTGKTTLALAFASDMFPTVPLPAATMYLNASDERTMETVRERIREFLRTSWAGVTRKIVVFDEVETMTEPAQLTLRALMDSPLVPGAPLPLFLFLCNTISRIVPLVRSRALAIYCGHLSSSHIASLIEEVQIKEGKPIVTPSPLACLLNRGDMRSFLQRAQQEEDPNEWLPWIERLFNSPADGLTVVWEEGFLRTPAWVLFRNVLVFCYSMGINEASPQSWSTFLETVIHHRSGYVKTILDPVVKAWASVIQELKMKG